MVLNEMIDKQNMFYACLAIIINATTQIEGTFKVLLLHMEVLRKLVIKHYKVYLPLCRSLLRIKTNIKKSLGQSVLRHKIKNLKN